MDTLNDLFKSLIEVSKGNMKVFEETTNELVEFSEQVNSTTDLPSRMNANVESSEDEENKQLSMARGAN